VVRVRGGSGRSEGGGRTVWQKGTSGKSAKFEHNGELSAKTEHFA